jgi:hypothetical protein
VSGDKNNGLAGLAIFGAVMFGIGRCSVATPPAPEQQPAALLEPVASATSDNSTAADNVMATTTEPVESPEPRSSPAAALAASSDSLESLTSDESGPTCGSKRYCREMNSCGEAMHYLNDCGVGRLDGDGDGIPCESIC